VSRSANPRRRRLSVGAFRLRSIRSPRWTGFTGKTLWDWLELLLIPVALAAVAFGLNYFANERDQRREDRRAAQQRALAADATREDALRVYLQQMSSLMLERDLRTSRPGSDVQAVARAFTLTVLRRLDPERKGLVVRFLGQAGLIGSEVRVPQGANQPPRARRVPVQMPPPKVDLAGADLRDVALPFAELTAKSFEGADLRGADFRGAYLEASNFKDADLRYADFREAYFVLFLFAGRPTSFDGACLTGARFAGANLVGTEFGAARGRNVDFSRAILAEADLRQADLISAKLDGATTEGTRFPPGWAKMLAGFEPTVGRGGVEWKVSSRSLCVQAYVVSTP